ncbi:C-GCAxxG-C-C family (seleno)protein [Brevibacillus ginsengisoli]|uniref:C-GCAxxG-C-C family (seleno)protein n=1 Tax=Brevibacillus ginsengisoli TaxID=363854 RepID=UPI003CED2EF4
MRSLQDVVDKSLPEWAEERAQKHHQSGLNGAQSVLKAMMDAQIIPDMPTLVEMTATWKGGVCGQVCSALAGGTLVLGTMDQADKKTADFQKWFMETFGSHDCSTITKRVGGRPSPEQKAYCDQICQKTAYYLTNQKTSSLSNLTDHSHGS